MEILWILAPNNLVALDDMVIFHSDRPLSVGLAASMFAHADVLHLLGNMLVLYFIGVSLEERIGTPRTAAIYMTTGLLATVGYALLRWGQEFALVGASGAVSGLMGAILVLYPRDEIPMLVGPIFLRRVPVWIAVGAFMGMEVVLTLLYQYDQVAHAAHVVGLVAGMGLAPLVARAMGEKSAKATRERDAKVAEAILRTSSSPEARAAAESAITEEIDDVRWAWLERALELTRCPKCSGSLERAGDGLACPGCKAKF
jgi:membrane associated rhomboid family serine protease